MIHSHRVHKNTTEQSQEQKLKYFDKKLWFSSGLTSIFKLAILPPKHTKPKREKRIVCQLFHAVEINVVLKREFIADVNSFKPSLMNY